MQKGVFGPVRFEKSAWAMVSMPGVLKAGRACMNVDASPSIPALRRKARLDELSATLSLSYNRLTKANISRDIANFAMKGHAITSATILKAAWALTLAQLTSTTDVVFGYVTSGRNFPMPDIERIFEPCMAIILARIPFVEHAARQSLLHAVQVQ